MNLIEQLGGYEKAKNHRDYLIDFGNEFNRPNKYEVKKINNALLEYRRQHNIFEAGDLIVLPYTNYRSDTFELTEIFKKSCDEKGIAYRHATDEEIKAGKRLEVNQ